MGYSNRAAPSPRELLCLCSSGRSYTHFVATLAHLIDGDLPAFTRSKLALILACVQEAHVDVLAFATHAAASNVGGLNVALPDALKEAGAPLREPVVRDDELTAPFTNPRERWASRRLTARSESAERSHC